MRPHARGPHDEAPFMVSLQLLLICGVESYNNIWIYWWQALSWSVKGFLWFLNRASSGSAFSRKSSGLTLQCNNESQYTFLLIYLVASKLSDVPHFYLKASTYGGVQDLFCMCLLGYLITSGAFWGCGAISHFKVFLTVENNLIIHDPYQFFPLSL